MRKFIDAKGREWTLSFTAADAFRFKRELGLDVNKLTAGDDGEIESLLQDSWRVLEMVVLLLGPQIENKGFLISKDVGEGSKSCPNDDFWEGFYGDYLDSFTIVFLEAVSDSLPKLKRRALLAVIKKLSPMIEIAAERMETKISEKDFSTEMINLMDSKMEDLL